MNRNALLAVVVIGVFVIFGVFQAFAGRGVATVLTLVWVAAWAFRFWELR